jgi:DNA-binding CsgD family transcriptional regulator
MIGRLRATPRRASSAKGLTNPEIGARLYIARRTVETHLGHVFAKIGVSSRAQVAAEAARRGA